MVLETMWFRAACLGFFFPPFPHYFIFFLPFWGFCYFRGILDIFGGEKGFLGLLEAF